MVLPTPEEVADFMGLSPVPGPPVLKKPTPQEVVRLSEMYGRLYTEQTSDLAAFVSQLGAAYLPSLVQTLLIMPLSLEGGPSGEWWELHIAFLGAVSIAYVSAYLQRFLRQNETDGLRLYVLVVDTLGALGHAKPGLLQARLSVVRDLLQLWRILLVCIFKQLPLLAHLPQLGRETLEGLDKLRLALPVARAETFLPAELRTNLRTLITVLLDSPEFYSEVYKEAAKESPGSWWRCDLTRDVERWKDPGSVCVQLAEGEEMMACSRCLTVRYCSKEHQKKDWKNHREVCLETKW